ncbi:MAG: suppressor of fused domain protein [Gammaproteobacteria bacterium]|nr:suppressor of fused domain protein [Gammaproteobacteria bacterium]
MNNQQNKSAKLPNPGSDGNQPGSDPHPIQITRSSQIKDHVSRFLGPVESIQHESLSDRLQLDLLHIEPTADWPYHRLVTAGMSSVAMTLPEQVSVSPYLELVMTLPEYWKVSADGSADEHWYWPINQLKFLAGFPLHFDTWLGYGHTVPNGEPPEPYHESTQFSGVILLPSVTVDSRFHQMQLDETRSVQFLSVVPLYPEEIALKLKQGADALTKRFDQREITDIVDPDRVNVSRKRFGLF